MTNRIAIVDRDLCKPKVSKYICMKSCPVNRTGKDCITVNPEDKKILIDEDLCIGCGICVKKCPRDAIKVVNLPEKLEEPPLHRYGKNKFALFRLPIPKKKSVVGLVGENGMGKSTVLKILSGSLIPNRGRFGENSPTWEDIIGEFKGTELQSYLSQLSSKSIKTSYKPQNVDDIPDLYEGKVRRMLKKADERGEFDRVVKDLGIQEMLEKDISSLSGGELQLLAVAAAILKKADFYFFDEPSSYLDVRERLQVARNIRSLSENNKVMAVEHDLAVSDYLADHTHVLYGKPGAFGIVSGIYGVRVGINTYLNGYLKEENMRFREQPIVFRKSSKESEKTKLFMQFPGYKVSFPGFSLETSPGNLYQGEIIGILGPNAIGKTTFIRMLVGEVKPESDSSEPLKNMKLAYKPQRLVLSKKEKNMRLSEFLRERSGKNISDQAKKTLKFLGLEKLLERKTEFLSGGELQSSLVASVLMQDKDIMLLDEPSAFLDVEQRLRVAKLIKSHVEDLEIPCFVVDHDLLFIDSLSDRVMVFSGQKGVKGTADAPYSLEEGMNKFLRELDITFRRDPQTGRPRANKPDSQKDREQKESGQYYYAK